MKSKWLAIGALGSVWAIPVQAQMVQAREPDSVVQALQEGGYVAKLGTDAVGDPMITSASSGTTFQIFFYNCSERKACATVQFYAGYALQNPVGLDLVNQWNREKRFGRAYLDKTNDPILVMDVDLDDGGMPRLLFMDNVEFWTSVLCEFEKRIGYRK